MDDRWTSVRGALHRADSDAYHAAEDIRRAVAMLDRVKADLQEAQVNLQVAKERMKRLSKLAAEYGEEHCVQFPYGETNEPG